MRYSGWNGFKFPNTYCFALSCRTLHLLYLAWLHKIFVLALLCSTNFKTSEIKLHSIYGSEWWQRCTLLLYPTYCFIHTYSILLGAKQQNVRWQLSYEDIFWVMRRHFLSYEKTFFSQKLIVVSVPNYIQLHCIGSMIRYVAKKTRHEDKYQY